MVKQFYWPIDRTLTGPTVPDQSGPKIKGNEEMLHISLSSRTEASPWDGLVSYQDICLGG